MATHENPELLRPKGCTCGRGEDLQDMEGAQAKAAVAPQPKAAGP